MNYGGGVAVDEGLDHVECDGVVDWGGGLTFPAEGHGAEVEVWEASQRCCSHRDGEM